MKIELDLTEEEYSAVIHALAICGTFGLFSSTKEYIDGMSFVQKLKAAADRSNPEQTRMFNEIKERFNEVK